MKGVKRGTIHKEFGDYKNPRVIAARVISRTRKNRAFIKQFRKLGMSRLEMANALKIPEDSELFNE